MEHCMTSPVLYKIEFTMIPNALILWDHVSPLLGDLSWSGKDMVASLCFVFLHDWHDCFVNSQDG